MATGQNTWRFHNNCGSNIILSSNGLTAKVKVINHSQNRVLISREPMSTNNLYEILVEETDNRFSGEFILIGVCEENPLSITLSNVSSHIRTFVGVQATGGAHHGQLTKEFSCPALATVKDGSRIGVMIDTSHSFHVYVDGKDQGVIVKNVAQPCYAMFDLYFYLTKVTTLPVSPTQ